MKKIIFQASLIAFLFPSIHSIQAQNKTGSKNWTKNPFEEKVFVENKTQFDGQDKLPNSAILFGVRNDGVQIYFIQKGLTYRHDEFVPMSEAEKDKAEKEAAKSGRKMDADMMRKRKTDCISMQWENANPNVQIFSEDEVSNYFTYPDLRDKSGKTTIKAFAYKKIIYKNLYPNIDVEYSFPENKIGIKYTIILHPGADVSQVKMKYSENGKINLDASGNADINSNFGNIIDHAPKTYYENGNVISSKFTTTQNTVSFALQNYDHAQTVIIDPWVTVPGYTTGSPYDVDADLAGNVYIYGDGYPHIEVKLNNLGTILWTYTALAIDSFGFYGGFAVDEHSQNSYLVEGFGSFYGAKIIKINPFGFQLAISVGNINLEEMWRIVFNNTTRTGVIGTGFGYEACVLDTTLSNVTPINVLEGTNTADDICLLAQDNNNNCYMADAYNTVDSASNNFLFKSKIPTILPISYEVSDGYKFKEIQSISYTERNGLGMFFNANGFNGMAVNNNYLYTYDGAILKKWNAPTGVLLGSVAVEDSSFKWGGLQVDSCNDIFVGAMNSVKQYDVNLNLINTIATTDTVYDLKLGTNNLLYACGKGFVQSIQLDSLCGSEPTSPPIVPTLQSSLIIPNVFSPNGDGKNDVFKVQSIGISTFDAKIFDRWGIQLFEWTNPNIGWNGETKTGNAPDGTYYYLINATGIDGKKYLEKGFVTLIR
ncbi:MAG: gliding motility-associated C-terminal domain-containing protein [Bacteroidia bacterium]